MYKICLKILIWTISLGLSHQLIDQDPNDGFYIIAHMTNNEKAADWAIQSGANAIEMDLFFNDTTGLPTYFYHGFPCDCALILDTAGTACEALEGCEGSSIAQTQLHFLLSYPTLALIYIDSKVSDLSIQVQKLAGQQIIIAVEIMLQKGYKGKIVISAPTEREYLISAAEQSKASKYHSQIYFMLDWDDSGPVSTLEFLQTLSSPNIIYSIGGVPIDIFSSYHTEVRLAAINKAHGSVSNVFTWTRDKRRNFEEYYISGARGIITNRVKDMVTWAKGKGLHLATPGDLSLQPAYSSKITTTIGTCTCEYNGGGCKISQPAPSYSACKCKYVWIFKMCLNADVVPCQNQNSPFCYKPDTTIDSCWLGNGNCNGYGLL